MSSGSQEQFDTIVRQLADGTKKYETNAIKYYQWVDLIDRIFASYGWSKTNFYAELNARLGIQTHDTPKPKEVKKKAPIKKKVARI